MLQSDRFRLLPPKLLADCIELGSATNCHIFNVANQREFLNGAINHLSGDVDGAFVNDPVTATKTLPTMAEFVIWHLLLHLLKILDEDLAFNAQNYQWFSTGSPNSIDITALKNAEGQWKFYAIEVKWSENCDYYGQVRSGLVNDLDKLHRADYSNCRLGTHVTALKTRLRQSFSPEEMEQIFSEISAGTAPNETKGIEFWGFFVSDWSAKNQHLDPDEHFQVLATHADTQEWPKGSVKGFMVNICNGKTILSRLSMGDKDP